MTSQYWRALDDILVSLQDIDPEDMTVKEYRSAVFQKLMDMRPKATISQESSEMADCMNKILEEGSCRFDALPKWLQDSLYHE